MRYRALDLTLFLTATLIVAHIGLGTYRKRYAPRPRASWIHGSTIRDTAELGFEKARLTLVLVTSSTCRFCAESLPFYRKLVPAARNAGARVLAVTAEEPTINANYLSSEGIRVDAAVSSTQNGLVFRGTPTLVVVGRDGTVVGSWAGKLSSEEEIQVLAAVLQK